MRSGSLTDPDARARTLLAEDFDKLPHASQPDVWLVYRTNPAISFWDTKRVGEVMAKFLFTVCFAFTLDETNHFADVLLVSLMGTPYSAAATRPQLNFDPPLSSAQPEMLAAAPDGDDRDLFVRVAKSPLASMSADGAVCASKTLI